MDIKLKNRHRISFLLATLVVLIASFIMVKLYPYFESESIRYEKPLYEEEKFLTTLIYGNYVLGFEETQLNEKNIVSPFQYFFPNADTKLINRQTNDAETIDVDYLKSLRNSCVQDYEMWKRDFKSIRNSMDYQVIDENGKVLNSQTGGLSIQESNQYVFKAILHYDDLGLMEVVGVGGDDTAYLLNSLQSFGDKDPMEDNYWKEYKDQTDYKMKKPHNLIFAYGMTKQQIEAYHEFRGISQNAYRDSRSVSKIFIGLLCTVAVIAFFLSCVDATWSEDNLCFKTPFEIVAGISCGAVAFGLGLTSLVEVTNKGELYDALLRANFLPEVARNLVKAWNILWWFLTFAVVYWSVVCVRAVLTIGLGRYFRERTLCGRFLNWLKCIFCRSYKYLKSVSLQEKSDRTIIRWVVVNLIVLAIVWACGAGMLLVYSVVLFLLIRKYYRELSDKYRILLKTTNQIAEGNLDVAIEEDLGVFEPFKNNMQKIQNGFKLLIQEEIKSQKLKTDLISNMSHDLKTPLTAIITYVSLLKDSHATPEQRSSYIDVLEKKSLRLKSLIEDLFEISKANSNNVTLNLADVDIVSLLKEVSLELSDKIKESTIDFRWNLPDEKIVLPLDGQKTYRIFDNLLSNIIKYAMPNTRAYIDMKVIGEEVVITLKNVSAAEITLKPEEITERFARGDQARNTEGSGLGMAIAKSFVELQNGKLDVEVEADLFRAIIRWPLLQKNNLME